MEKRGYDLKSKPLQLTAVILAVLGVLCILYCVGISLAGFGTLFFLVWAVLGVICILLGGILASPRLLGTFPRWLKRSFVAVLCCGLLLFGIIEAMVLSEFHAEPEPNADYCVILGAQWKSTGPSDVLRRRLDAAVTYLLNNPDTQVIVSGGQGSNETITEASGMQGYLINAGIAKERILVEDESSNTYENLVFSGELLDKSGDRVVIVTSNFHVFRALKIAGKQGYENVEGLAASSVKGFLPNNMLREFIGVMKDFLVGNL